MIHSYNLFFASWAATLSPVSSGSVHHNGTSSPVFAVYVDSKGIDWAAQPPKPIVDARSTKYTHVIASFYLPSLNAPADFASTLLNPNPIYGGVLFIKATKAAGKKVMIAVGGDSEHTGDPSYYSKNEPLALGKKLVDIVKQNGLDGVNIDWEDDWSNDNPGLTGFGPSRSPGSGPAIPWLCNLTKELRSGLPVEDGFVLSHSPQPSYFDLGYAEVHQNCGDSIDFYSVQYYNQGPTKYLTYESIFEKESFPAPQPPKSTSLWHLWDGSVADLTKKGVPPSKIVIGKPIASGDARAGGQVNATDLHNILIKGKSNWDIRGAMAWQWGSDTNGEWINQVAAAWGPAPPGAPSTSAPGLPPTVLV